MRVGEVLAEQADDLLQVAVENREPLARTAGRDGVLLACDRDRDRTAVGGHAALTQRSPVADRIGLEDGLLDEAEAGHPKRERDGLGDHRVARVGVRLQEISAT